MKFALLVFCLFLVTYIPRMLPAIFMDKIQLSTKATLFLQLIPYTAMTALVFPGVLTMDSNRMIGVVGSVVAIIASLKKCPVVVTVLLSVIACFLMYCTL